MNADNFKQLYAFVMLIITVAWAAFTVYTVDRSMDKPEPIDVLAASGSGVLLGALINWNGDIKQFWFRKAKSELTNDSGKLDESSKLQNELTEKEKQLKEALDKIEELIKNKTG